MVLPKGHDWQEVNAFSSSETAFQCSRCWATAIQDAMDNSFHYEPGDGACAEGKI